MQVGDPCPLMYGWTILALREACPEHGCQRFDLQSKHGRHFKICPQCWRSKKREYARRYREANKIDKTAYLDVSQPMDGIHEIYRRLWSYKADQKIDEFWATRGMTDEDAKRKLAPRFRIRAWSSR